MATAVITKTTVRDGKPWHVGPSMFTWQSGQAADPLTIGVNAQLQLNGFTVWISQVSSEYFLNIQTVPQEVETHLMERNGPYLLETEGNIASYGYVTVTPPPMKTRAA